VKYTHNLAISMKGKEKDKGLKRKRKTFIICTDTPKETILEFSIHQSYTCKINIPSSIYFSAVVITGYHFQ
jgi:ribosomal protein L36